MAESSPAKSDWTRLLEFVRKNQAIWSAAGVVFLAALVIVTLWKFPQWQVGQYSGFTSSQWFDHVNEARKTLATIMGGIVVLAGAYFTWRNIKLTQKSVGLMQKSVATAQKELTVSQEGRLLTGSPRPSSSLEVKSCQHD